MSWPELIYTHRIQNTTLVFFDLWWVFPLYYLRIMHKVRVFWYVGIFMMKLKICVVNAAAPLVFHVWYSLWTSLITLFFISVFLCGSRQTLKDTIVPQHSVICYSISALIQYDFIEDILRYDTWENEPHEK